MAYTIVIASRYLIPLFLYLFLSCSIYALFDPRHNQKYDKGYARDNQLLNRLCQIEPRQHDQPRT